MLLGSMNLDPRSAWTNTELGVTVWSPQLAERVLRGYGLENPWGFYQVRLKADGKALEWLGARAAANLRPSKRSRPPVSSRD